MQIHVDWGIHEESTDELINRDVRVKFAGLYLAKPGSVQAGLEYYCGRSLAWSRT